MQTFLLSIRQQRKLILQIGLGLLFLALGIFFIHQEKGELVAVKQSLSSANINWVIAGGIFVIAFVWVQGLMYVQSFSALGQKIHISTAMSLFLKRNLVSIFLPAGVLTNMLFFNKSLEKKEGVTKSQSYIASSIFSLCSVLSSIVIAIPALIWLGIESTVSTEWILGIVLTVAVLAVLIFAVFNILKKGRLYRFIENKAPSFVEVLAEIQSQEVNRKKVYSVLWLSIAIEAIGVAHLYISMAALGTPPSLQIAFIGYAVVLLILMSSPFLRGIGVIEVALTYTLTLFGIPTTQALSIAFLFRFFEFWSITVLGVVALVAQRDSFLIRILPALLIFVLGAVNIFSGITPALPGRLAMLKEVIPLPAINVSVSFVIVSGIILMGVSVYLLRGLRSAWIIAVILSGVSLIAHLSKGIDYEEASIALLTLGALIYQRKQYFVRLDKRIARSTIFPALAALFFTFAFGVLGFYFLKVKHFNADFTFAESVKHTFHSLLMLNTDVEPITNFGKEFILTLHIIGAITLAYIAFIILRPLIFRPDVSDEESRIKAKDILAKYGKSSLDYFKTYSDKRFWFDTDVDGFVSFKVSQNYAVSLENPVCKQPAQMEILITGFDEFARENGLRTAYYRVPHSSIDIYEKLKKKVLPIGEEAIVNLTTWTTQGGDKKALRNAINKLTKTGYEFRVSEPPQKDAFLQQLEAVSQLWLKQNKREELLFSQGKFDKDELKNQTILILENGEGKVEAFVNLIPNGPEGEGNFDLMRKTDDAPHGTMDFLFVNMFEYMKNKGFTSCNLGIVPLSGIQEPGNLQERIMKLAYEKIKRFSHYKSLRDFKEKFDPTWEMMYLVYTSPFDLIYLPGALEKVNKE